MLAKKITGKNSKSKNFVTVYYRLTPDENKALKKLARHYHTTQSEIVRRGIHLVERPRQR